MLNSSCKYHSIVDPVETQEMNYTHTLGLEIQPGEITSPIWTSILSSDNAYTVVWNNGYGYGS